MDDDDVQIPGSYNQCSALANMQPHGDDPEIDTKPKIILMGMRRSGKSSIKNVVFHKMPANETMFLESTTKLQKDDVSKNCFMDYVVYDFPGQVDSMTDSAIDYTNMFEGRCALIYVIDVLEDKGPAVEKLVSILSTLDRENKLDNGLDRRTAEQSKHSANVSVFVFIHKVDGLPDDQREEEQKRIETSIRDELNHAADITLNFKTWLTSVYEYSIFHALSDVNEKLIDHLLPTFEDLLHRLKITCCMDTTLLMDVSAKCYIAKDNDFTDHNKYEMCCDMLDLYTDIANIYSHQPYDDDSYSCVILHQVTAPEVMLTKYLRNNLILVCLLQESCLKERGIINQNIRKFSKGIGKVLQVQSEKPCS